jgi:predicted SnoaL-like aldol condensation-catalyzing enzyme
MGTTRLAILASALLAFGTANAEDTNRAACVPSTETSRELVRAFYTKALVDKQVGPAFEQYVAADFVEHKPDIPGGNREGVIAFLGGIVKDVPEARWEILRTVADNDLVFMHVRMVPAPGAPPYALADLFRVEDCKIVEHWDVVEPHRDGPNTNSRF